MFKDNFKDFYSQTSEAIGIHLILSILRTLIVYLEHVTCYGKIINVQNLHMYKFACFEYVVNVSNILLKTKIRTETD